MNIQGLQKLTLLDFPGKTACTVFTGGCNFRCPFCHNADLVQDPDAYEPIGEETVIALLEKRRRVLEGVCVTGGEPLLQPELAAFLGRIKALGYAVKLDTNGSYPERLKALINQGLVDYVAMDIKNAPDKYALTIGREEFDLSPVRESIELLMNGDTPYEFRTTVVKELHTPEDIAALSEWIRGAKKYFLQAFVDSGKVIAGGLHACSKAEMTELLAVARKALPQTELRGI